MKNIVFNVFEDLEKFNAIARRLWGLPETPGQCQNIYKHFRQRDAARTTARIMAQLIRQQEHGSEPSQEARHISLLGAANTLGQCTAL